MSQIKEQVRAANAAFAESYAEGGLPKSPARQIAVLTCMDARLDLAALAGLAVGDAHVIRNAGGRASNDAIRSLVISHKLFGTREWFVIHHTDCGMETFTNDIMRSLLAQSLDTATIDERGWRDTGEGPGSVEGQFVDWMPFADNEAALVEDVARIRSHPLVARDIPIFGFMYDVRSGRLTEVEEASRAGATA